MLSLHPRHVALAAGIACLLALVLGPVPTTAQPPSPETIRQNEEDFDFMWSEIRSSYAYFDEKATDWDKVKTIYRPWLKGVRTRTDFIRFLEEVQEELYDHHAHLNTNTPSSPKLIPSGTDLWAAWKAGKAVIEQVRPGSPAERAGMKAGMEVFAVDGDTVRAAVHLRLGRARRSLDQAAMDWALRVVLAGRHGRTRRIVTQVGRTRGQFVLEDPEQERAGASRHSLHYERLPRDRTIGYIRIHNSLGSVQLLREFDAALEDLEGTVGLVLDLRDTPSGGNTTVARGIMGRFIERDGFYQKHSLPEEERTSGVKRSWMEIVSPRGEPYKPPVVILVDHWTGSMGEGIAIGMDGLKRATVVGTRMAGLLGATRQITLPHSGIGVSFPAEKLFHVNGTPREEFVPPVLVDLEKPETQDARDPILAKGLETLQTLIRKGVSR